MTAAGLNSAAERIYRIANFAPGDRDIPLTDMDSLGLDEVRAVLGLFAKEQDRDTRHACAEVVNSLPVSSAFSQEAHDRVHAACMNARAI